MKIKPIVVAAGLAFSMPFTALAGMDDKTDEVIKALNLSGPKAEQVKTIMDAYHDQRKQVKERAHENMEALKEQKKEKLDVVLTDAEMDQLDEWYDTKKKAYENSGKYKDCKKYMDK